MDNEPAIPDNLGDLREQIQAAQAAMGSVDDASIVPDALPLAPTFYSRLQLAIAGLGGKPIQSEAVKNRLKKAGKEGFSEEEWKWAGMDEFLGGRKTVTRDELMKHFEENQVELVEVLKGGTPEEVWGPNVQPDPGVKGGPKYAGYQTPGGENYRELLLMLPSERGNPLAGFKSRMESKYGRAFNQLHETMSQVEQDEYEELKQTKYQSNDYHSSHWDEDNILAHVRFNDRTGPSGERILHVEEIQSDWHQAARESGYASPDRDERLAAIRAELGQLDQKMTDWRETVLETGTGDLFEALQKKGLVSDPQEMATKFDDFQNRWIQLIQEREPLEQAVPDAPFKENWHELAMKRMLRYAAENDYDRITLNPGEQINKVLQSGAGALEGQKQFYDVTLPNTMAKLGKPFGAKVEPFEIAEVLENLFDESEAEEIPADFADMLPEERPYVPGTIKTASLPITAAMSQSILGKGMPMMAQGGDVPDRFGISYPREHIESFDYESEPVAMDSGDDLAELLAAISELDDATGKLIDAVERQDQEASRPTQSPTSNAGGKPRFGKPLGGDGKLSVDMLAAYARNRQ
jgi:hypothetical protein